MKMDMNMTMMAKKIKKPNTNIGINSLHFSLKKNHLTLRTVLSRRSTSSSSSPPPSTRSPEP